MGTLAPSCRAFVTLRGVPRDRLYATNAERQAAYRARTAERLRALADQGAAERIRSLEVSLAKAERRADKAEKRVRHLEAELATRLAVRSERQSGPTGLEDIPPNRRVVGLEREVLRLRGELAWTQRRLEEALRTGTDGRTRTERRDEAKRFRRGR